MVKDVVLALDTMVDLQLHTVLSDGEWTPEALIDYLVNAGFGLAAITDHDRADTQPYLQAVANERNFPLLRAVEVSSMYDGQLTDFLCYGFATENSALQALTNAINEQQSANTKHVFAMLQQQGYPLTDDDLATILAHPSIDHVNQLVALVTKHHQGEQSVGSVLLESGFAYATAPPAAVVEAAHASGAICILGHPGRSDGFFCYDEQSLDTLRQEAAIDGIEVYYPLHSPEQTQQFLDYATRHDLLISAGSDSHSSQKPPIMYRAEQCRHLLERLGIRFR